MREVPLLQCIFTPEIPLVSITYYTLTTDISVNENSGINPGQDAGYL